MKKFAQKHSISKNPGNYGVRKRTANFFLRGFLIFSFSCEKKFLLNLNLHFTHFSVPEPLKSIFSFKKFRYASATILRSFTAMIHQEALDCIIWYNGSNCRFSEEKCQRLLCILRWMQMPHVQMPCCIWTIHMFLHPRHFPAWNDQCYGDRKSVV